MITLTELEQQARQLSVDDRARLAEVILESLHGTAVGEIEEAWALEIERRVTAFDRGEISTVPAEAVFAEARRLRWVKSARFVDEARAEFLAEVVYYADLQPGLGVQFAAAVEEATARALAFPMAGSPSQSGTRRVVVKQFPFSVIYQPEPEGIVVFAVAHQSRRPGYWRSRVT